jgi:hypothetical protein
MNWIDQAMSKYGNRLAQHTIEVPITDLSGQYALPDDTIMRSCHIVGIYATANDSDDKKAPSGRVLIGPVAMRNSYLSIKCNNLIVWKDTPLAYLTLTTADRSVGAIDIQGITPNQSFVRIADTAGVTVGESVLLHILYIDNK